MRGLFREQSSSVHVVSGQIDDGDIDDESSDVSFSRTNFRPQVKIVHVVIQTSDVTTDLKAEYVIWRNQKARF